jgi:hypothetical protein
MALAQGSGELIWWPYLVAKYGLLFLFLLIPSCLLQYPLNLEIGRYTLLTGESIFRGFLRLSRGFGIVLWILMTLSFLWFGAFATAGGTALAALTGFPAGWSPKGQTLFWGYASIAVFGAALVFSGVVYRLIENFMKVVAVVTVAGLVWACLEPEVLRQVPSFARGLLGPPPGPPARAWDPGDATKLLTGITFVGLGGFWILLYSYWLGEKGAGMGWYSAPITGLRRASTEYQVPSTEYGDVAPGARIGRSDRVGTRYLVPDNSEESRQAYSTWRRYLTVDALIGVTGNLFTTLLTCLLAWALLFPKGLLPQDYDLAVVQSRFFEVSWGPLGRVVFLIVAAAFLTDTWLATTDGVSRMQADIVTTLFPRTTGGSVRRWYWICLGLLVTVTCLTMLLDAPGPLILLSAVIGFAGTVTFPVALYLLNYRRLTRVLPAWARPGRTNAILLALSFVCYLALAVLYVGEVVGR